MGDRLEFGELVPVAKDYAAQRAPVDLPTGHSSRPTLGNTAGYRMVSREDGVTYLIGVQNREAPLDQQLTGL